MNLGLRGQPLGGSEHGLTRLVLLCALGAYE